MYVHTYVSMYIFTVGPVTIQRYHSTFYEMKRNNNVILSRTVVQCTCTVYSRLNSNSLHHFTSPLPSPSLSLHPLTSPSPLPYSNPSLPPSLLPPSLVLLPDLCDLVLELPAHLTPDLTLLLPQLELQLNNLLLPLLHKRLVVLHRERGQGREKRGEGQVGMGRGEERVRGEKKATDEDS